jgi:hypothetical protein
MDNLSDCKKVMNMEEKNWKDKWREIEPDDINEPESVDQDIPYKSDDDMGSKQINRDVSWSARQNWERIFGIILMVPALISVPLFIIDSFTEYEGIFTNIGDALTGGYGYSRDGGGGGYTSGLPFYFGLMAIAGAFLFKKSNKD